MKIHFGSALNRRTLIMTSGASAFLAACGGGGSGTSSSPSSGAAGSVSSSSSSSSTATGSSSSSDSSFSSSDASSSSSSSSSSTSATPAPPAAQANYYFVSDNLRVNDTFTTVATRNHRIDIIELWSPDYACNYFRIALPAHFTYGDGTVPSEAPLPNVLNIDGVSLQAYLNGAWVTRMATLGGQASWAIDPAHNSVGVLLDDVVFDSNIPAGTHMMLRIASNVPVNGTMMGGRFASKMDYAIESAATATASLKSQLTATGRAVGGTDRLNGRLYCPTYVIARPINPLDRPVFIAYGDSITYGKGNSSYYFDERQAIGFISQALDDRAASRRMAACNLCCAGVSVRDWKDRSALANKLDLICLAPNRPYTHMISELYNSGGLDNSYRTTFGVYYDMLLAESRAWSDTAAPLYQTRPIPHPSSKDFCTTLAGQAGTDSSTSSENLKTSVKWSKFDVDLQAGAFRQLAGSIDVNRDYAYDQGANRNKVRLGAHFTVAQSYTAGDTSIVLNERAEGPLTLVINSSATDASGYVVTRTPKPTGSGTYTYAITAGSVDLPQGSVIAATYVGDLIGTHPSTAGASLLANAMIDWKNATFG